MANVPKIDYTGPVKNGRHTGAQTESALNCMVLQPIDDYGTYNETGNESYVEKWKGPISAMLKVNDGFICMGKKFVIGLGRPDLSGGSWIRRFDPPTLPKNWFWMVKQIKVEQANPAGDHGTLVVDYVARNSDWTVNNAAGGGRMDASKSQWSLEWQNRSATALIYLTNKYGKLKFIKWVNAAVNSLFSIEDTLCHRSLLDLLFKSLILLLVPEDYDFELVVVSSIVWVIHNIHRNNSLILASKLTVLLPCSCISPVALFESQKVLVCILTYRAVISITFPVSPLRHRTYDLIVHDRLTFVIFPPMLMHKALNDRIVTICLCRLECKKSKTIPRLVSIWLIRTRSDSTD